MFFYFLIFIISLWSLFLQQMLTAFSHLLQFLSFITLSFQNLWLHLLQQCLADNKLLSLNLLFSLISLLTQIKVKKVFRFLFSIAGSRIQIKAMLMVQKIKEIMEKLILGLESGGTFRREVIAAVVSRSMKDSVLMTLQMMSL